SPAERQRRRYWRAKGKARREPHENDFRESHENPPLKEEEEKKERAGAPISKDWRPDPEGVRLGKKAWGDEYESALADHIDYCLMKDYRSHDHGASWRRRCRAVLRDPQLKLNLRPSARQLVVKDREATAPRRRRRGSISAPFDDLIAEAKRREANELSVERGPMCDVTPPASEEGKAQVQA